MLTVLFITIILYLGLNLWIGWYSKKQMSLSTEDYYMGNRSFGTFVLFCTILGTNMSTFTMLGVAGLSYRNGIGIYALVMGGAVVGMSLFNWIFGARAWALGKKFKYVTSTEYIENRFMSPVLTTLVFIVLVMYTLPYITIGMVGAGAAFENFSDGVIPYWLGALIVSVIVGYYIWSGGMRGTALTNLAQTLIFLAFLVIAVVWIGFKQGGPQSLLEQVRSINPDLLHRGTQPMFTWQEMLSYIVLYSINLFAMPHLYTRFMTAKSAVVLRKTATLYPLGVLLTFIPACILGFWGVALIPGLEGAAADNIIFMITREYLPSWMFALAVVALLAIVMSSMDAQTLTVASLFTNDVMKARFKINNPLKWCRVFIVFILVASYVLCLLQPTTIFDLAVLSFTGTASLIPVLVGAMYFRRINKQGAIASVLTSLILVPCYFATTFFPESIIAQSIVELLPRFGFQPIIPVLFASLTLLIIVTLLTPKQENEIADEQFKFLHSIYNQKNKKSTASISVPNEEVV
ncbi:sodium:solute symporter family protein [Halalkalibacterium ligniniphilum]|uniref:sodium:solute symporter family protein n=1 Tax=Halalkalibacterium ligniniphilum TaxID=1134413 RepID=UPI0003455CBC|nr:sodium:solute symporter family protein [Halalkalibacterium ligniniphilum]